MLAMIFFVNDSIAGTPEKILYIAKNGNDNWSGELALPNKEKSDGPLASFEAARDRIRELKKITGSLPCPVNVQVREGVYRLDKPFILGPEDSGSKNCPVTYMAYPGEQVKISGGKMIRGKWEKYKDGIYKCVIPEVKGGKWYFRELFVNGERKIRARIPDSGFMWIADLIKEEESGEYSRSSFKYHEGDLKKWHNLTDVEILIFQSWDMSRIQVGGIDEKNNIMKLAQDNHDPFTTWNHFYRFFYKKPYARYYVENVLEGLDSPGEWYLDKQAGKLYYWPRDNKDINNLEFTAPVLNDLFLLKGDVDNKKPLTHVRIKGFTFCETDWTDGWQGYWSEELLPAAVTLYYTEYCNFEKNTITNVGANALKLKGKSAYNKIDGNEISYIGASGILVGQNFFYTPEGRGIHDGTHPEDGSTRNLLSNNHVHHCGIIWRAGIGISIGCSPQNIISHNHVHHIGYCGMNCRGKWSGGNIFEYNHIHHVMYDLCDGGGIFTFGDFVDGTIIRNNLIHDVQPYGYFARGIYLDNYTDNVIVMDNLVYRCETNNMLNSGSNRNTWLNNVFVDAGPKGQFYWNSVDYPEYNRYTHNIIYYSDPNGYLFDCKGDSRIENVILEMDYNLYYYTRGGAEAMKIRKWDQSEEEIKEMEIQNFADWQKLGYDENSIIADPLFVNPENDDYRLRPESPAFELGIRQIDMSTVGPQE
ncbi:right-handed parallel beta-helix repeat-containing protein [Bacteroidota bacterium]